jgi:hypothetical protein
MSFKIHQRYLFALCLRLTPKLLTLFSTSFPLFIHSKYQRRMTDKVNWKDFLGGRRERLLILQESNVDLTPLHALYSAFMGPTTSTNTG